MNGNATTGETYILTVPKVYGTSGQISIVRVGTVPYTNTLNYTLVTTGAATGFLRFDGSGGIEHGIPLPGLGLVLCGTTLAQPGSNAVFSGLIFCTLTSAFDVTKLAGKSWTTFTYKPVDQNAFNLGLSVGFTTFTSSPSVVVTSASILPNFPAVPTSGSSIGPEFSMFQQAPTFLLSNSQVNASNKTLLLPNLNGSDVSLGLIGSMGPALTLGFMPGSSFFGEQLNPGSLFALPQEKSIPYNAYKGFYNGTYKLLVFGMQTKWQYGAPNPTETAANTTDLVIQRGTINVSTLTPSPNVSLSDLTIIADDNESSQVQTGTTLGNYVPFSTSTYASNAIFTKNKMPGTFIKIDALANTCVTFSGMSTKQKFIVISYATRDSNAVDTEGTYKVYYAVGCQ
jgi:hypothetical protein